MTCTCATQHFAYDSIYMGKRMNFTYCPSCGEKIREKCPDCGRMERIGRTICETRIAKISSDQKAIREQVTHRLYSIGTWGSMSFFIAELFLVGINRQVIGAIIIPFGLWGLALIALLVMGPLLLVGHFFSKYYDRKLARLESTYWAQNPEAKADWDKAHGRKA